MRLFKFGCWVMIFTGCSHLIGELVPVYPVNSTEAVLFPLMRSYEKHVAGGKFTAWDIQTGLSLFYTLHLISFGTLGQVLVRSQRVDRRIIFAFLVTAAIGLTISLIFFFWLPVVCFIAMIVLFAFALLKTAGHF